MDGTRRADEELVSLYFKIGVFLVRLPCFTAWETEVVYVFR